VSTTEANIIFVVMLAVAVIWIGVGK